MCDETVVAVAESLRDLAFANGVDDGQLYALADAIVNRLLTRMADAEIMDALEAQPR